MNTHSHPDRRAQAPESTHAAGDARGWRSIGHRPIGTAGAAQASRSKCLNVRVQGIAGAIALLLTAAPAGAVQTNRFFTPQFTAQTFIAPYDADYSIVIAGASGGDARGLRDLVVNFGGLGAFTGATFFERAGTHITLLVGQRGGDGHFYAGAGGGAGTVVLIGGAVAMIAGGGGGAGFLGQGLDASTSPDGTSSGNGLAGSTGYGGGGGSSANVFPFGTIGGGGGGAGFYGDGGAGGLGGGGGGIGSTGGNTNVPGGNRGYGGSGGLAGGGGSYAGGGGGGYAGGAGGDTYSVPDFPFYRAYGTPGGGGGSLNNWDSSIGISATNPGNGYALISYGDYIPPPITVPPGGYVGPPGGFPPPLPAVPEPATWLSMLSGLAALAGAARTKRRRRWNADFQDRMPDGAHGLVT